MAYLEGELTAERAAATAAHLGGCAECQALAAELRGVSAKVGTWEVRQVAPVLPAAITAALEEQRPVRTAKGPTLQRDLKDWLRLHWARAAWAGAAATAVVLIAASVLVPNLQRNRSMADLAALKAGDRMSASLTSRREMTSQPPPPPPPPPSASPAGGVIRDKQYDRLEQFAKLQQSPERGGKLATAEEAPVVLGPMIIRTAQLSLITKEFDKARANVEAILKRHRGYVGEMKVGSAAGSGRTLTAMLRVPSDQLDATMAEMKALGRVDSESQNGQDVTSQYVDLEARLANARNTSQRLTDLLRNRTGKLSDVLEVEQELDRVRGEIEQMEAERKAMANQVTFATLNATITEEYQSQLQVVPPSTATRLGNAAVEGYRSMVEGVVGMAVFLLSSIPTLLIWGAILFFPSRWAWRKLRHGPV